MRLKKYAWVPFTGSGRRLPDNRRAVAIDPQSVMLTVYYITDQGFNQFMDLLKPNSTGVVRKQGATDGL